jgi:hypothetical protein
MESRVHYTWYVVPLCSFAPYNEWATDYPVTKTLCPPDLQGHPRYTAMCVNLNAFSLVLHHFIWTNSPIAFEGSLKSYHELTALLHGSTNGWTLLQEFIWSCSQYMNSPFWYYHHDIHLCFPNDNGLIDLVFLPIQELSHDIFLSRDISGMQHELLHNFVHNFSQNVDSGLTKYVLLNSLMIIKQLWRTPSHPKTPLPFTYHDVLSQLCDADITHFQARCSTTSIGSEPQHQDSVHDPIVAAAHLRSSWSPSNSFCRPHPSPRPSSHPGSTTIHYELCLDHFSFPLCPFLDPDNIKDR